jgi:hypothetical protein
MLLPPSPGLTGFHAFMQKKIKAAPLFFPGCANGN